MHTDGEPVPGTREDKIRKLERLPDDLERIVAGMTDGELDMPYRAGGWTVRQVVHHAAAAICLPERIHRTHILDLLAEEGRHSFYAGEREVRRLLPGASGHRLGRFK